MPAVEMSYLYDRAQPQSVCVFYICLARDAGMSEKNGNAYREPRTLGPHPSVETGDAGLVHHASRDELVIVMLIHKRPPRHVSTIVLHTEGSLQNLTCVPYTPG